MFLEDGLKLSILKITLAANWILLQPITQLNTSRHLSRPRLTKTCGQRTKWQTISMNFSRAFRWMNIFLSRSSFTIVDLLSIWLPLIGRYHSGLEVRNSHRRIMTSGSISNFLAGGMG